MSVAIVGASLAGGRCAESLRRFGYEGSITLIGDEPHRPYDRPPLSKKALLGELEEEKLFLRKADYYDKQSIDLRLGARAAKLDAAARQVLLEDGAAVGYESLVVATGAGVRRLRCPGAELDGVHYVRTLEDSRALREALVRGKRAVVIGGGVIGAEVAASCRSRGVDVVLVEMADLPLVRAFGKEVGAIYAEIHRAEGVDLRCGVTATELQGEDGQVRRVRLDDGSSIECDFVVVGIGVTPSVGWLEGSPVAIERGAVLVDERCQTNVEGIYAAGDVAAYRVPELDRHVRVESVDNAQLQAKTVAKNLTGDDHVYAPVPFFWSDQYRYKLQSVGLVTDDYDRVIYRGSVADRAFVAFHMAGDRLRFAIGVNRLKEIGVSKKLIGLGVPISDERLADESVPAKALLD